MYKFVKDLFPEFPEDRKVVPTMDWSRFFKIDYNKKCLYVPTEGAIRAHLSLIDSFMDAVGAFAKADLTTPPNWNNTSYITDNGSEISALSIIHSLHVEIMQTGITYIACDIETRRVEYNDNKVLAIGFGDSWDTAKIITKFTPTVVEALQQLFATPSTKVHWIWHNGKFDTGRLKWLLNIDARVDEDTMLMHYCGINERRGTHGLKDLGSIYLQAPAWDDALDKIKKDYCRPRKIKLKDFTYDMFPQDLLLKYLHFDCIATYRLYFTFKNIMREDSYFIYNKLIKASNTYRRVELNGVKIDIDYLESFEYELESQIAEASKEVSRVVKTVWNPLKYAKDTGAKATIMTPFNMGSPKQLKWLLETVTGKKLPGTDKETLAELFDEVGDQYPVVNAIRNLRKLNKYMDTYVAGFRDLLCADGRIHGTYNLHGTETGRLSSSEPNMQNIPRDPLVKNLIVAEDGYQFVQLDYSQAELRVLAYLSKDKFLTGVYQRDEDLHDAVATQMFGPDFTKEQRVQAKTINFGVAYGRGPANIAQVFKIPMMEAKALINNWFDKMPQVKAWIDDQRNLVLKNITPKTPLGRERHFVVTYEALNHIQNEYVNFPIQSIASDMTMFSLLAIQDWIDGKGYQDDVKIVLSVHDSIVLEVRDDKALVDEVAQIATNIMKDIPQMYLENNEVPFKADAEVGYQWGMLKGWEP